jgi:hypothetical protein
LPLFCRCFAAVLPPLDHCFATALPPFFPQFKPPGNPQKIEELASGTF